MIKNNKNKENLKILFWSCLVVCLIVLTFDFITANDLVIRQGSQQSIQFICQLNSTMCSSSASCNLTAFYPNTSLIFSNQLATNNGAYFNKTLLGSQTTEVGTYHFIANCNDQNIPFVSSFDYEVNGGGRIPSIPQAILYILFFTLLCFVFVMQFIWYKHIPSDHQRDQQGYVSLVNSAAKFKFMLWFTMYLTLLAIVYVSWIVTNAFLFNEGLTQLFFFVMIIMLGLTLPIGFGFIVLFAIKAYKDAEKQIMMTKGYKVK